ncbi:unnamed protein product [Cuscuta europaea]|uniref:PROP1-like PPR domain-containing protein n=1 Tax=Cuscuta europaea TaxID=41803 RepID=A0A9P0YRF9_CUSEU|nr:unnamed protein product [Cuscuta europaea]
MTHTMKAVTNVKKHYFPSRTSSTFTTQQPLNPIFSRCNPQNVGETHFISLIHSSESTLKLKSIHAQVLHRICHSADSRITTQLISASCQHGSVNYALLVFQSCDQNLFLFNAMIRGLCKNSCFESSIRHFKLMLTLGVQPDRLTLPFVLKSVMGLGKREWGAVVHCGIFKMGLDSDLFVRVSMVDMYAKIGLLDPALQLFDESLERNKVESVLLWNVAINGCCKGGKVRRAVELFESMPERNIGSWNSLIDGLMRNREPDKALELFDGMEEKNVVSWTTVIYGLMHNGLHEKALQLFFKMLDKGVKPNNLTVVSALSACAKMGALEAGIKIHNDMLNGGFKLNTAAGNALLDMYAKSGDVESASRVFKGMKVKDICTWGSMIWGLAIHGCVDKAIECFETMNLSGIIPDEAALVAVLTACSHAGRVDQGLKIFNSMRANKYSVMPSMKHYAVIVDLFGRAGQLDEALRFIESMPMDPDHIVWGALFCACSFHKNIEMAQFATDKLLKLAPKHPGSYVFLSNVYAGAGRWSDVDRIRTVMKSKDVGKDPGWSSIELDGKVHTFKAGDRALSLLAQEEIYSKLEGIMTNFCYD